MPITTPTPRPIDVVRIEANTFKLLGFEVHTESDDPPDDRIFVRKEARTTVDGVITARTPMRGTEYTAVTVVPVFADLVKRLAATLGMQVPPVDDSTIAIAFYVAFRDALYDAERRSGEFPADAT